jgi:hypothetical protein
MADMICHKVYELLMSILSVYIIFAQSFYLQNLFNKTFLKVLLINVAQNLW